MVSLTIRPITRSQTRIWIADPRPADYDCLTFGGEPERIEVCFFASAREVLRHWSAGLPDACLVNTRLPGTSGFELVEMLRPFPPGTIVCLVGDSYLVDDEVRALRLGVHRYLCKPLEGAMLSEFWARRRTERRFSH